MMPTLIPWSPRLRGSNRLAAAQARGQTEFDWQWPHSYPLLLVSEVAELFECDERQVRDLADEGRFLAFAINHDAQPQREILRIVRATVNRELRNIVLEDWVLVMQTIDGWLFPHRRQIVTVRETAAALRCFPTHVRELYRSGNVRGPLIGNGEAREHVRIERASVVDFVRRKIRAKNGSLER